MPNSRPIQRAFRHISRNNGRLFSSLSESQNFTIIPRHFLSIADLTSTELVTLIRNAHTIKKYMKPGSGPASIPLSIIGTLTGQSVAIIFSKRSTRTRISTEGAVAAMGGHPMFLGKDDIQLGVNESLYDTSVVISSMVAAIVARVGPHSDIAKLAQHSTVPVINALSDLYHPMQTIADFLTIHEAFSPRQQPKKAAKSDLGLKGLKIAWVGDANNVLYDLAIGATKLGVDLAVATPKGYGIPPEMRKIIEQAGKRLKLAGVLSESNVPEEAIKDADIVVTDTWVSMGQEEEKARRLKDFEGFRVTKDLIQRGGAKPGWRFMHCLPRHPEEVSDEVFYSPQSLVFQEAENRLWAAIATLEGFVVNKGEILQSDVSDISEEFNAERKSEDQDHILRGPTPTG